MKHPLSAYRWHSASNSIITLSVKTLKDLESISAKLHKKGITVSSFYEPDIESQLTSIAFIATAEQRKKLSHLPLALKSLGRGIDKHHNKTSASSSVGRATDSNSGGRGFEPHLADLSLTQKPKLDMT